MAVAASKFSCALGSTNVLKKLEYFKGVLQVTKRITLTFKVLLTFVVFYCVVTVIMTHCTDSSMAPNPAPTCARCHNRREKKYVQFTFLLSQIRGTAVFFPTRWLNKDLDRPFLMQCPQTQAFTCQTGATPSQHLPPPPLTFNFANYSLISQISRRC